MNKPLIASVLIAFGALTGYTLWHYGGLWAWLSFYTRDPASWQIFADLLICIGLLLVFVYRDAQANGRRFWPWAILSLCVGSFGPLLYFLTRKERA
jgi:hypothetical protein